LRQRSPNFKAELDNLRQQIGRQEKLMTRLRGQASELAYAQQQNNKEITLTGFRLTAEIGEQTREILQRLRESGFDVAEEMQAIAVDETRARVAVARARTRPPSWPLKDEPMRTSLGQPVIVENVIGASGTIGVARAVCAAPDGYTVSIGNWPSHVVNGAIYTLPYDIRTDFEPVARLRPLIKAANIKAE
jgi:hypothetical protein